MLPITRTKTGPGEKEPAYVVQRTHFCKFFACLALVGLIVGLKLYSDGERFDDIKLRVHGMARRFEHAENSHARAHAEMAKVGEEFDQHLDRDMRELEAGQHLLKVLRTTHAAYKTEVAAIVDAVFANASGTSEQGNTQAALAATKVALQEKLDIASEALYEHQTNTVNALVKRLAAGAREAQGRKSELQGEILHNLEEATEHAMDDESKTDEWDPGENEPDEEAGDDGKWAEETERWHNETVEVFFEKLHNWLHPNATVEGHHNDTGHEKPRAAPSPSYTNQSAIYGTFKAARADLDADVKQWRVVQDMLHVKAKEIEALGLPPYTDADEPEDDGYQGFQSWHVQSYLDDVLWPAMLRARLPELLSLQRELSRGEVLPMDVVERLETLAAENVVPHHWLHHGGFEYYGGRDDYF